MSVNRRLEMMKWIAAVITTLANGGIAVVLFFMLLLSLNGFSEDEAKPGLILFIVWVVLVSIITGVLSFLSVNYLVTKKSYNPWLAALLAIVVFIFLGSAASIAGVIAAIIIATAMH